MALRDRSGSYEAAIAAAAKKYNVDPAIIRGIMRQETGHIKSNATAEGVSSPVGALGLMQVMPATGRGMGYSVADLKDPTKNIEAGTQYISKMLARYNGDVDLALSAYNAGPGKVKGTVPSYTKNYVAGVKSYSPAIQTAVAMPRPKPRLPGTPSATEFAATDWANQQKDPIGALLASDTRDPIAGLIDKYSDVGGISPSPRLDQFMAERPATGSKIAEGAFEEFARSAPEVATAVNEVVKNQSRAPITEQSLTPTLSAQGIMEKGANQAWGQFQGAKQTAGWMDKLAMDYATPEVRQKLGELAALDPFDPANANRTLNDVIGKGLVADEVRKGIQQNGIPLGGADGNLRPSSLNMTVADFFQEATGKPPGPLRTAGLSPQTVIPRGGVSSQPPSLPQLAGPMPRPDTPQGIPPDIGVDSLGGAPPSLPSQQRMQLDFNQNGPQNAPPGIPSQRLLKSDGPPPRLSAQASGDLIRAPLPQSPANQVRLLSPLGQGYPGGGGGGGGIGGPPSISARASGEMVRAPMSQAPANQARIPSPLGQSYPGGGGGGGGIGTPPLSVRASGGPVLAPPRTSPAGTARFPLPRQSDYLEQIQRIAQREMAASPNADPDQVRGGIPHPPSPPQIGIGEDLGTDSLGGAPPAIRSAAQPNFYDDYGFGLDTPTAPQPQWNAGSFSAPQRAPPRIAPSQAAQPPSRVAPKKLSRARNKVAYTNKQGNTFDSRGRPTSGRQVAGGNQYSRSSGSYGVGGKHKD